MHDSPVAFVFDLDGTLVDSRRDIVACEAAALESIGIQPDLELLDALVGQPLPRTFRLASPGLSPEQIEAAVSAYRVIYHERMTETTRPFAGVVETLQKLKSLGSPVAIATIKRTHVAFELVQRTALSDLVDQVVGTDEPMEHKPMPDVILAACSALKVRPEIAWAVGDTPTDLLAAKAAGCNSAAALWGAYDPEGLAALGPDEAWPSIGRAFDIASMSKLSGTNT